MDDPSVAVREASPRRFELRADASYLVTGGLSGFGLATAKRLVERGARNVILVGRRGAVTPEAKKGIAGMEKAGARVIVGKADASREEDLKRVLEVDAKGLPPLRGVVHAAMVLEDGIILQGTREQFAKVMAPKMLGALHLHRLTKDLPLDFFVLYSSATTMIGNPGQFNYVAANLYLESLAAHRRSLGLPALSVAWGAILDVGYLTYNEDVREQMEARMDLRSVSASDSLDAMERHALAGSVNVSAAHFNWSKTLKFLPSGPTPKFDTVRAQGGDDGADSGQSAEVWALLAELSEEERQETVTQLLAEQVAKVLRMSPSKLDVNKSLLDMGIDSLMGVEMRMVIDKQFGVDLPAMELMGGASIAQLAARILKLGALPAAESAKTEQDPTKAIYEEIDKEVDELSEEALDVYLTQLAVQEKGLTQSVS
jgi:acyl carrier protein